MLLYLALPPFDLGWLAWVALVPMIVAQFVYGDAPAPRHDAVAPRPEPRCGNGLGDPAEDGSAWGESYAVMPPEMLRAIVETAHARKARRAHRSNSSACRSG